MARTSSAPVVVVGSLNMDLIAAVQRLPLAGETVCATGLQRRFGGKGANQALAAARQGAQVTLIACLGDDPDGRDYRNHLRREGINCSAVNTVRGQGTGSAFIVVDPKGENQIVVIPGANAALTPPALKVQRSRIEVAKALLIQLEVPLETVVDAIEIANRARVPVILNPSPCNPQFPWGKLTIDVLIVNRHEAEEIFGKAPVKVDHDLDFWKTGMQEKGLKTLIITRGEESTLILHEGGFKRVATHKIKAVDTVGAGDTFAGAFTTHFAEGAPVVECVRWANTAAALSTLQSGAQEGVPQRGDVQSALA
ncbi:MAG: ribokinase [Prosthecobacter sp.]|nr:ribokinase [Prosthecobacter sp.]